MFLSPLLKTRHLNSKQNLLEVIELFLLCAQSGLNFKQLHQQEIDQKQMSTLLSSLFLIPLVQTASIMSTL